MIYNKILTKNSIEILSLNDSHGKAYLSAGSATTRVITLSNHPHGHLLTKDNLFISFGGAFTYSLFSNNVTALEYTYNPMTYTLTVTAGASIFHPTELAFDRDNWKLIIVR